MESSAPGTPVFLPSPPPADAVGEGRIRVLWALGGAGRDLDANLVRLGARADIGEHTETVLGVLLVVVAGSGELRTPEQSVALAPGAVAWLPAGTTRSVRAGADGLTYTTSHRRRPPLGITTGLRAGAGEPACLASRVCAACGRMASDAEDRFCARCGEKLAR
ncbi:MULTISPECIES: zinc ribbon domain-containing protein [Streptomyces]|uniref:zinc ribbon domain-containing protein n=1 Tax=Streptomyces TaxID=1883 RepID=UPI000F73E5FC|nr:zinc ribbon domain-containing protein [Streptomyces sp. WAC05292]RSS82103.1 hypothetical protein EF903_27810 [Streptomyces sp. WAC05292]